MISHFTIVYGIKRKSEYIKKFREFEAEITAMSKMRISKLTVDQGREYKSKQLK